MTPEQVRDGLREIRMKAYERTEPYSWPDRTELWVRFAAAALTGIQTVYDPGKYSWDIKNAPAGMALGAGIQADAMLAEMERRGMLKAEQKNAS